jgi:hypothetical protein
MKENSLHPKHRTSLKKLDDRQSPQKEINFSHALFFWISLLLEDCTNR